uniref:Uncharacterized protein n=1 Tax=Leersia perrieri TaxID=77586 RepID=A0A0D9WPK1_9ORYZ
MANLHPNPQRFLRPGHVVHLGVIIGSLGWTIPSHSNPRDIMKIIVLLWWSLLCRNNTGIIIAI